jgi:hypothetical protein
MASNSSALVLDAPSADTNAVAAADIRDLKPPVDIPTGWEWLWWTLGALVVAAVVAFAIWWWWRRANRPQPPPLIPPHVRARERLNRALDLIHEPKPFCIEVSDAMRVYLEERFQLHAPERTTEEFLLELQSSDLLNDGQKQRLAEFLSQCDLVKFARAEPIQPELESLHRIASQLVEETDPNAVATPGAPEQPAEATIGQDRRP